MQKKVLTIDDQGGIRRLIRMTLEFEGHDVLEASDGDEGLRMARQHLPDLILLDIMMPGSDGLAVCETIHKDPVLCKIPVILLTGKGTEDGRSQSKNLGAREYLTKPFNPMQLLELVEQHTSI